MRKTLLIIAIVVLALVPIAAYMLFVNTPTRADVRASYYDSANRQELTQQQQADLQESHQKMIDLRKETVNKMVQDGLMTEEQGQLALAQLDEMAEYYAENGYAFGYGMMNGCNYLNGNTDSSGYTYGRGMMRGYDWN